MSAFVYVLRSRRNGRFYVGFAAEPTRRLAAHNDGLVQSTRHLRPWDIVYVEELPDETPARKREYPIKSMKSRAYIQGLISLDRSH